MANIIAGGVAEVSFLLVHRRKSIDHISSRLEPNSSLNLHPFGDLWTDTSIELAISCKISRLVIFLELLPEVSFMVR